MKEIIASLKKSAVPSDLLIGVRIVLKTTYSSSVGYHVLISDSWHQFVKVGDFLQLAQVEEQERKTDEPAMSEANGACKRGYAASVLF